MLNKKHLGQNKLTYKTEVASIFTYVTDFDNEEMYLYILTQATIKCAFLRYKKVILLLLILWGNPNLFLDVKYHSLEHAETKQNFYLFFYKEN